jgi:hypothetical protein
MQTLKDIIAYWPVFVAIGGAWAVVYATIKVKVPSIENRLEEIEKMDLITKNHCLTTQADYQSAICAKIDLIKADLKADLKSMDKQRQDARYEFYTELKQINLFIGRVEQFMADHIRG